MFAAACVGCRCAAATHNSPGSRCVRPQPLLLPLLPPSAAAAAQTAAAATSGYFPLPLPPFWLISPLSLPPPSLVVLLWPLNDDRTRDGWTGPQQPCQIGVDARLRSAVLARYFVGAPRCLRRCGAVLSAPRSEPSSLGCCLCVGTCPPNMGFPPPAPLRGPSQARLSASPSAGHVPDDAAAHACVAAWMSDWMLLSAALLPRQGSFSGGSVCSCWRCPPV